MNSSTLIKFGLNRRHFLRQTSLGGIALHAMLQAELSGDLYHEIPQPHFKAKAKNVIFLFMCGGASHLETFDHKPFLSKYSGKKASEIFSKKDLDGFNPEKSIENSKILKPVFPFRRYGQSGAWMTDIYPNLSALADEITFIKSMVTDSAIHSVGQALIHTGHSRPGFPSIGSWLSYGLGSDNQNLPSYVVLKDGFSTVGDGMLHQGMLPNKFRATIAQVGSEPFDNLRRNNSVTYPEQRAYLDTLQKLNKIHQRKFRSQPELQGRIDAYELAYRLQSSAPEVFDISKESKMTRSLYGEGEFANHCLVARRLVEKGVRFVEILDGAKGRKWDAHGNRGGLIDNHRNNAARTDQGIAALLKDLKQRGLLDETLVVWATEFGRTPFEEAQKESKIGRSHHHKGFSIWMAGGGVKKGFSFGATDDLGFHAIKNPVHVHDWHATILHLLGLDHEKLNYLHNGRETRLTDVFGDVVHQVIA